MKLLYINTKLNLPHYLNYIAALPFKCLETPDLWHPNISDLNPVNYKNWVIVQHLVYQTKICSVNERRVIDVWCGPEQLTINMLLTTSVEDFERASIRKEDNSNTTCELTILILSVSVTFSVTFVWLLPCYIFHSKSVTTTSTIRPISVFVFKAMQRQNQCVVAVFIPRLGADIWCLICLKILKSDNNCQSYSKYTCSLTCSNII